MSKERTLELDTENPNPFMSVPGLGFKRLGGSAPPTHSPEAYTALFCLASDVHLTTGVPRL